MITMNLASFFIRFIQILNSTHYYNITSKPIDGRKQGVFLHHQLPIGQAINFTCNLKTKLKHPFHPRKIPPQQGTLNCL